MGIGRALIVGVPQPSRSSGWTADYLGGVGHDVRDMSDFFERLRFNTSVLYDRTATANGVLNAIEDAAGRLTAGDLFVFNYSGHGAQLTSSDSDEARDQLLLTYDRPIVDDQLGARWKNFKSGVRIVVLTDSCHSGSVVRELHTERGIVRKMVRRADDGPRLLSIGLDEQPSQSRDIEGLRGTLLHMAACQDPEKALDLGSNGAFTYALLSAYGAGYRRSYQQLHTRITQTIRSRQVPRMTPYGVDDKLFLEQMPFDFSAKWPFEFL